MPEETRVHLCGATLICPDCQEPVRNLPPTDLPPGRFDRTDYSHHDGSSLCPMFGDGSPRELQPARPVAFLPARALHRP